MNLINESEIYGKWSPIIESTTGIEDKSKLEWMSKYCHNHELYESNAYATVGSVNGMGATRFPGDPGSQAAFGGQDSGSGDKPYTLLPLAMQVAAQTVGLDLVPVVPMNGPMGVLTYLDFVYGGGLIPSAGQTGAAPVAQNRGVFADSPLIVKVKLTGAAATQPNAGDPILIENDAVATTEATGSYVGVSRIDGFAIFKIDDIVDAAGKTSLAAVANGGATITVGAGGAAVGAVAATDNFELVKALEDHVQGFSSNQYTNNEPMSRLAGESNQENVMNLSLFNKSVEAQTFQVAAAVTREQVQDLKQFGIDAVAQVESVLINELTQSINKNILDRIRKNGYTNHGQVVSTQGVQFNLWLGAPAGGALPYSNAAFATGLQLLDSFGSGEDVAGAGAGVAAGTPIPIFPMASVGVAAGDSVTDPTIQSSETNSAAENLHTRQRKIMSKILATANLIAIRGRRGPATFVVTNGQVGSALQDCAGFVPAPMMNTLNQQTGSLYPIGTLAGLVVYVDPLMAWSDTRVTVGRKGDGNSPGLVFMPYLMAESVQTIAEGTMAPKIAVKSRYALVEAGFHPQTMYLSFGIQNDAGQLA
jgi:hypothetical protein